MGHVRATVITDASFDHRTRTGGWAAWIRIDGVPGPVRRSGILRELAADSSEAEMRASAIGIFIAAQFGATQILVQTDCMTVVHAIKGKGSRVKAWHEMLAVLPYENLKLQARHVKGHTANPAARSWVNRWCDENAKAQMRLARDAAVASLRKPGDDTSFSVIE